MSQIMDAIKNAEATTAALNADAQKLNANIQAGIAAAQNISSSPAIQEQLEAVRNTDKELSGIVSNTQKTLDNVQKALKDPPKIEIPSVKI